MKSANVPPAALTRRRSSQIGALGLMRRESSSKAIVEAALEATEAELRELTVQLEAKRSFVAEMDDLMRSSSSRSVRRIIRSETSEGSDFGTEIEEDDDFFEDDVEDLRDVLAASDMEVELRLAEFCPAAYRDSVRERASRYESDQRSTREEREASRRSHLTRASRRSVASVASERASANSLGRANSGKSLGRASSGLGSSRLDAVCRELIETESRYTRDLQLIVHSFVQGLRRASPGLVQPFVANAEELLQVL